MKRTRTGGSYVYKGGRGQTLALEPGRRGTIQVTGKAAFTPEEFRAWLTRATWYVDDLVGSETAIETASKLPQQLTLPLPETE